jgi:hypothetical protein
MFTLGKFWKDSTGGSLNLSNDGMADLMQQKNIQKSCRSARLAAKHLGFSNDFKICTQTCAAGQIYTP